MNRVISLWIIINFFASLIMSPQRSYAQEHLHLPVPGTMVNLSPAYVPVLIKGLKVHPENPLLFDFILNAGKSGLKVNSLEFKTESEKLIKYFLASLTIKEDDLWVNLSPYEKDRMIPLELGQTELGREMLEQDYILKQLTASLIYPERRLGQEFWNRVYAKAQQMYGTANVPMNTFNKVWIVADRAKILEHNNVAYVVGSHLKVMLEEDYMALEKHSGISQIGNSENKTHSFASQIVREIIIPELEKEVNQGQNFAPLRQMFYSMILATWYRVALKNALLNQVYSNKGKTGGVLSDDPTVKERIYERYLEAYKKGVFNYIKEDIDAVSQQSIPRKYFSGGLARDLGIARILDRAQAATPEELANMDTGDLAMATVNMTEKTQSNGSPDTAMTAAEIADRINYLLKNKENLTIGQRGELHELIARAYTITTETYIKLESQYKEQRKPLPEGEDLEFLQTFISRIRVSNRNKPINILDIGTGIRDMRWYAQQHNVSTIGIDVSYSVIESIKTELGSMPNIAARVMDMNTLDFPDSSFDGVRVQASLHHLPLVDESEGMDVAVKEMYRVLKPGGECDILVKAETESRKGFMILDTKEGLGSRFYYFISREELLNLLQRNGFEVKEGNFELVVDSRGEQNWMVYARKPSVDETKIIKPGIKVNWKDRAMLIKGGLDLNAKNMHLDLAKEGQGIDMIFDPVMVAQFQRGDFAGIVPDIIRITPISSVLPILGLQISPG